MVGRVISTTLQLAGIGLFVVGAVISVLSVAGAPTALSTAILARPVE